MKKLFFMAVAAIAALSSCTSDNDLELNQNTGKEALTFTATIEGSEATRATFDDTNKCAAWEEGDEIYVIDYDWDEEGALYKAGSDLTTFTESVTGKGVTDKEKGFEAYFPASIVTGYDKSKDQDEQLSLVLPSVIEEEYGHFNMPMYGVSDESSPTKLNFTNLCGVLAITVKSDQMEKVKSIKVSSSNLAMSGKFTVYATDVDNVYDILVAGYNDVSKTVTVNYKDEGGVETGTAGKTFYVAIPPETYKNLKIEVSDGTTTKTMTTKKDVLIDVVRNTIYPITFKDNSAAPTNQINGHEYVELAGYYWATENVYGATATEGGKVGSEEYGSYYVQNEAIKAAESWGDTWTLPTAAQWQALLDGCTWEWKTDYEFGGTKMSGYLVSDKTDSSKFIFLPAAGFSWKGGNISYHNQRLLYWSSTVNNSNPVEKRGTYLYYNGSNSPYIYADQNELTGFPVRPVAAPTKGKAKATIGGSEVDVNWVQLWENGPKFAEYNVGATSVAEYGGYYCWGGSYNNDPSLSGSVWTTDYVNDYVTVTLSGDTDTATKLWGDKWRMPTNEEIKSIVFGLEENLPCTVTWTDNYNGTGIKGGIITGKGAYSTNSIFLPAAGYLNGGTMTDRETKGYYWSSQYDQGGEGWAYLRISSSSKNSMIASSLNRAYSVRAVLNE